MAFAMELLSRQKFRHAAVLIIDGSPKNTDDRTWSFWSDNKKLLNDIKGKVWPHGKMIDKEGNELPFSFAPYVYKTIRSSDFYAYAHSVLAQYPTIDFYYDPILECNENGLVRCEQRSFTGEHIIKSFFVKEDILRVPQRDEIFMWQHFKGWFVKTSYDVFDDHRVTWMDYRITDSSFIQFLYVLPFSKKEALIEYTEFSNRELSNDAYDGYLKHYIDEYLRLSDYQIVEQEQDGIPMTDRIFKPLQQGRVITIGSMAGYVKASTGFCFTRTFEQVKLVVDLLESDRVTQHRLKPSFAYWLLDSVLLESLSRHVFKLNIFFTLFQKQLRRGRVQVIFKFLDEKSSWWENIQIMSAMPSRMALTLIFLRNLFSGRFIRKYFF
jgi:lycopene beta-cyclase